MPGATHLCTLCQNLWDALLLQVCLWQKAGARQRQDVSRRFLNPFAGRIVPASSDEPINAQQGLRRFKLHCKLSLQQTVHTMSTPCTVIE